MNDPGWTKVKGRGSVTFDDSQTVKFHHLAVAPIVDEFHRCNCTKVCCHRRATAEDFLCDECRAECG